ncbi:MAG: SUMF1/EgtB/PvdO family nonheme iron enzyme [Candidatus Eisenbacteria bacterium]
MRNPSDRGRNRGTGRAVVLSLAAALLFGCGAQELYKPPTAPYQVVGRLELPSEVEDVAVLGDYAYLAAGQAGLIIVDISDPTKPVLVETLGTVKYAEKIEVVSVSSGGGVTDIAFVVEGTEGITTYDVTDPENAYSFNQGTTAVDGISIFVELPEDPADPYVIYLAESWKGLRIFESDPTTPGLLQYNGVFADTRGSARAVAVQDGFAYVADDQMGLAILDVRTRVLGSVKMVSSCDTKGEGSGIAVHGDYAYIGDYENGLTVAEIRREPLVEGGEPMPVPYVVGHLALGGRCQTTVYRDGKVFLSAQDGGVHMADVSDPTAPRYLGTVITSDATGIALAKSGLVVVSDRHEGLLVLAGGGAFSDAVPPAAVTDLAAAGVDSTRIRLAWTAPGNDGLSGTATVYDIRYAADSLASEADYDSATAAEGEPSPAYRGTPQTFDVTGLEPGTRYWFALKTADASQNWSPLSNTAAAYTPSGNVPPTLSGGTLRPEAGTSDTTFVFEVTYRDGDGDAPAEARLLLDGAPLAMTEVSGDYDEGALFRYEGSFGTGVHHYAFSFKDPSNPAVTTAQATGPYVGEAIFRMGSPANEPGRDTDETLHTVVFTYTFEINDHEVTQGEYRNLMGTNPSRIVGDNLPVENVTWLDAVLYCNAVSSFLGFTPAYTVSGSIITWNRDAGGYRLPTEAEWEIFCRAGTNTAFSSGGLTEQGCAVDPVLDPIGWYCGNAGTTTHAAGLKSANPWNLFDMHGNVREWCWDWYTEDLGTGVGVDPAGPGGGSQRVVRGGSWFDFARECRSASRAPYWPNSKDDVVGFRLARTVVD